MVAMFNQILCKADSLFSSLACPGHRNVNIIFDSVHVETVNLLTYHLTDLVKNDACFTVNFFIEHYGRFELFRGTDFDQNQLLINFNGLILNGIERFKAINETLYEELRTKFYERYHSKYLKISQALELLEDAPKASDEHRYTFVFMVESETKTKVPRLILKKLKYLQRKKSWDIIFYCKNEQCPREIWIPKHRIVEADYSMIGERLIDLLDLIKEPAFDRFKFHQFLTPNHITKSQRQEQEAKRQRISAKSSQPRNTPSTTTTREMLYTETTTNTIGLPETSTTTPLTTTTLTTAEAEHQTISTTTTTTTTTTPIRTTTDLPDTSTTTTLTTTEAEHQTMSTKSSEPTTATKTTITTTTTKEMLYSKTPPATETTTPTDHN